MIYHCSFINIFKLPRVFDREVCELSVSQYRNKHANSNKVMSQKLNSGVALLYGPCRFLEKVKLKYKISLVSQF